MSKFELVMPKMGESVQEATITKWFVSVGDKIEEDDVLVEIATDKVDSEIPSPVEGMVYEILFKEDDVVAVGEIIAVISLNGDKDEKPEEKESAAEEIKVQDKKINTSEDETSSVSQEEIENINTIYNDIIPQTHILFFLQIPKLNRTLIL